jgi:hypothetical protein
LQSQRAFITGVSLDGGANVLELLVHIGDAPPLDEMSSEVEKVSTSNGDQAGFFTWDGYWLIPLHRQRGDGGDLIGLIGVASSPGQILELDQREALHILSRRAAAAMEDRLQQQAIFSSLELLTPQISMIQRLRAATRYNGKRLLTEPDLPVDDKEFSRWVKDALTHYWGGPKLTDSPLMRLNVVQDMLDEHQDNPSNALRAILRQAIEQVRPEGERRFTGEWILYNILELKFLEGKKVREIALRLAMSEADLYRKQRVAIEAVAKAVLDMERSESYQKSQK